MKDFDDFAAKMNNADWSDVVETIAGKVADKTKDEKILQTSLELTLTLLREYHNWLTAE